MSEGLGPTQNPKQQECLGAAWDGRYVYVTDNEHDRIDIPPFVFECKCGEGIALAPGFTWNEIDCPRCWRVWVVERKANGQSRATRGCAIAGYVTIAQAAARTGHSPSLLCRWCREERLEGAHKFGNAWLIPADALTHIPKGRGWREKGTPCQ